jgi:uncharacterized membrane protein (UPF0182 family)
MEPTLDAALARLFGGNAAPNSPAGPAVTTATVAATNRSAGAARATARPASNGSAANPQLIEQASAQYERARAALKRGDFAAYGREIDALGQTLARLRGSGGGGVPSDPAQDAATNAGGGDPGAAP